MLVSGPRGPLVAVMLAGAAALLAGCDEVTTWRPSLTARVPGPEVAQVAAPTELGGDAGRVVAALDADQARDLAAFCAAGPEGRRGSIIDVITAMAKSGDLVGDYNAIAETVGAHYTQRCT